MSICPTSATLSRVLKQRGGVLAALGSRPTSVLALNAFVDELPSLGGLHGSNVSRVQVEAFAGLYYYGELESAALLSVAELLAEERYSLNLNDREVFEQLETMARAMREDWYGPERRTQVFAASLAFDSADDIRRQLGAFVVALQRAERLIGSPANTRRGSFAEIEFAMLALVTQIGRRGHLGIERIAQRLNRQFRMALEIVGHSAIHRRFNVRDMWGVIGAIANESGEPSGGYRQLGERAESGAGLLGWVGGKLSELSMRNGTIGTALVNDASVFRLAARWSMAATAFLPTETSRGSFGSIVGSGQNRYSGGWA